jgi:hypothetical protein
MRLLAQGESAFLNPSSDPVLDSLPESARQLVIGARRERDEAIEDAKQTRRTVKVMEGGLLDRLRDRTEKAEEKALEEVRARDALTRDMTAILGAPDPARLQQINDAVRELESAAQGLAEANQKYSDALLALSLLFYRLPVYTPCDPVNIEVERQERFTQPKGGSMDAYLSKQTDHA